MTLPIAVDKVRSHCNPQIGHHHNIVVPIWPKIIIFNTNLVRKYYSADKLVSEVQTALQSTFSLTEAI